MATILVVDDELGIRALLSEILTDEGHAVELAENAAQARAVRERLKPELVLLDIWMPDVDGISLLKEWGASGQLTMPVIMMSGHGTIDTAVEATKFGAMAFLEKPITLQKLLRAVEQALAKPAPRAAHLPRSTAQRRWGCTQRRLGRRRCAPTSATCMTRCQRSVARCTPRSLPVGPQSQQSSSWTGRCAKPATRSRSATSSFTWPRRTAR